MTQTLPPPLAKLGAWMDGRLERIQGTSLGTRLDPYLGLGELRRFNPLLALIPMVVLFLLGLRRSQFGHMDTVGGIFPIMALISGLNPVTGLLSALAYGAGDLLQKFVVDDVFYEGVKTTGDYWGARLGYLIAYSSLVTFGVLPGVCSRAGRKIAVRVAAGERGGTSGGLPSPPVAASASAAAAIIGSVLGGVAGALGAAFVWKAAVAPAFLLRPSPDNSCYALSGSNVIAAIPPASVAGGLGGGASTIGSNALGAPMGQMAPPAEPGAVPGGGVSPGSSPGGSGAPGPSPGGSGAPGPSPTSPAAVAPAAPPGTSPAAPAPGSTAPVPTEGVVVSGPEAITELVAAGHTPVVHDGVIYVKPPASLGGPISGIGFGDLITLPTGEQVIDPNNVAIVKNVPVQTGPTTSVQGGPAVNTLIGEGFPTYTDPKTGNVFVKYPPNLIHGNVTGIAVEGTTVVDGVQVIDPTKGVIVQQTGSPTSPPVASVPPTSSTGTAATAPTAPSGAGPATPPVIVPTPTTVTPPVPPVQAPIVPPVLPPVAPPPPPEIKIEPPAPPTGPPRTPTDAQSLRDSLTKPGVTVITPANVPGFAPDVIRPDGTIKVTDPKAPDPIKKLDGTKAPTPVIENGNISVAVPMGLGNVQVSLSVEGGRLQSTTTTSGIIKSLEAAAQFADLMFGKPETPSAPGKGTKALDAGKSVQARIDRYNDMISKAELEVKSVSADGGQIRIQTGPKS